MVLISSRRALGRRAIFPLERCSPVVERWPTVGWLASWSDSGPPSSDFGAASPPPTGSGAAGEGLRIEGAGRESGESGLGESLAILAVFMMCKRITLR